MSIVTSEKAPLRSIVSKTFIRFIAERDISTTEVSHGLLDLPFCHATRAVLNVDCRKDEDQPHVYIRDKVTKHLKLHKTLYIQYLERSEDDKVVSLLG